MVKPSEEVNKVFDNAVDICKALSHKYLTIEHFSYALFKDKAFAKQINEYGYDAKLIRDSLGDYLKNNCDDIIYHGSNPVKPSKTKGFERVMNIAYAQVLFSGRQDQLIDLMDIFLAIISQDNTHAQYYIKLAGIDPIDFARMIMDEDVSNSPSDDAKGNDGVAEKALKAFTINLNEHAKNGKIDPVIGRSDELDQIALALGRRNKNNVILVGDPGVGKTQICEGLAYNIINGDVPEFLKEYTVYNLDISAMVAGSKWRGDFEERFKNVLAALQTRGKAVLFIDEAHMINGAGGGNSGNSNDLANMMKPALAKGNIKVVASTTWDEYRKHFEKDRALMRRFHRITVDEPSVSLSKEILIGLRKYYEEHHTAFITDDAVDAAVDLSVKYITDRKLPDKAIDLIDLACSRFNIKEHDERVVGVPEIQFEISKIAKIPVDLIKESENTNLVSLSDNLKSTVFGQDDAIDDIVDKILVAQAGLKNENKPIGSFLLRGLSGVGKSLTAIQLSKELGIPLVRFDMSEFQEKHSVSKLIGSPPGYVGFDDNAGQLITKLQENPHCVLLLDELEKAHPDVLTILLQMMDNGIVTGSNGKTADCRNTIIMMTSNLGAHDAERRSIGFTETDKSPDEKALKQFLAPEFRNRLDGIITFNKLSTDIMIKVVGKFLLELKNQTKSKNIDITVSNQAIDWLVEKGFDKIMGARPLQRVIDKDIKRPLSKLMLFGDLKEGGTVHIDVVDGELNITTIKTAVEA